MGDSDETRWKVECRCGLILEAGSGDSELDWPREQLPCPQCGSFDRQLAEEFGRDLDLASWPAHVDPLAVGPPLPRPPDDVEQSLGDREDFELGFWQDAILARVPFEVPPHERDPRAPDISPSQGAAYQRFLEQSLENITATRGWRASKPLDFAPRAYGIGPEFDDVVRFARDGISTVADLAGVGIVLATAWKYLKKLGRSRPYINSQSAAAFAALAARDAGVPKTAGVAFVNEIRGDIDEDLELFGFVVGFRRRKRLWAAVVTPHGVVLDVRRLRL